MVSKTNQLDLFPVKPRTQDEALLVRALQRAARGQPEPEPRLISGMTRAAIKRLMTPLPRITVPW